MSRWRLSSTESVELARVVRRLADEWGMAVLVVEHDMNFVMAVCDQVVVSSSGTLIAPAPEDVRSDPAVIAAYLGDDAEDADRDRRPTPTPAPSPAPVAGGAS